MQICTCQKKLNIGKPECNSSISKSMQSNDLGYQMKLKIKYMLEGKRMLDFHSKDMEVESFALIHRFNLWTKNHQFHLIFMNEVCTKLYKNFNGFICDSDWKEWILNNLRRKRFLNLFRVSIKLQL